MLIGSRRSNNSHSQSSAAQLPVIAVAVSRMLRRATIASMVVAGSALLNTADAQTGAPSRDAFKGCKWERATSNAAGMAAWVQRCDYGNRKIHFFYKGKALMQQYSDAGTADALIEIFDLKPNESLQAGVQRVYEAKTPAKERARCVIAPYKLGKAAPNTTRYTFEPNAAYAKELKAKQNPNEVPEPPCGEWGTAPDGQQFFQVWPTGNVRKFVFVRIGQDTPLFDEMTLQLLPTTPAPAK